MTNLFIEILTRLEKIGVNDIRHINFLRADYTDDDIIYIEVEITRIDRLTSNSQRHIISYIPKLKELEVKQREVDKPLNNKTLPSSNLLTGVQYKGQTFDSNTEWVRRNGETIKIKDMTNEHIENSKAMILRENLQDVVSKIYIELFNLELEKRRRRK